MGSLSVTCHPAEETFRSYSGWSRYSTKRPRRDALPLICTLIITNMYQTETVTREHSIKTKPLTIVSEKVTMQYNILMPANFTARISTKKEIKNNVTVRSGPRPNSPWIEEQTLYSRALYLYILYFATQAASHLHNSKKDKLRQYARVRS